jgi:hypothetical protein
MVQQLHWVVWTALVVILRLKCDGTRWRTGRKVKGQLANGVGSQYSSHYLGTWVYPALLPLLPLMRTPQLPVVEWTDAPASLNGLVRFPERWNLVSARVPSHFKRSLHPWGLFWLLVTITDSFRYKTQQPRRHAGQPSFTHKPLLCWKKYL